MCTILTFLTVGLRELCAGHLYVPVKWAMIFDFPGDFVIFFYGSFTKLSKKISVIVLFFLISDISWLKEVEDNH